MIICRDIPGLASDYISREVRLPTRLAISWHMAKCRNCRGYVRGLRNLRTLAGQSFQAEKLPASLMERLAIGEDSNGERN